MASPKAGWDNSGSSLMYPYCSASQKVWIRNFLSDCRTVTGKGIEDSSQVFVHQLSNLNVKVHNNSIFTTNDTVTFTDCTYSLFIKHNIIFIRFTANKNKAIQFSFICLILHFVENIAIGHSINLSASQDAIDCSSVFLKINFLSSFVYL